MVVESDTWRVVRLVVQLVEMKESSVVVRMVACLVAYLVSPLDN